MTHELLPTSDLQTAEPATARELLPLLYSQLRALAQSKLRKERIDHSLQATALVHEAYLRLTGKHSDPDRLWESQEHFIGAAADTMRCILIDSVRRRSAKKRGGKLQRVELDDVPFNLDKPDERLLTLDLALDRLEAIDPQKAKLVSLRVFSGLTQTEAAELLGLSLRTANRQWAYARAWLLAELKRLETPHESGAVD